MFAIYFENRFHEKIPIGSAPTRPDAYEVITKFLEEKNFKSYYWRFLGKDTEKEWIDVGSHNEFFWVEDEKGE